MKTKEVKNPYSHEVIENIEMTSKEEALQVLERCHKAYLDRQSRPTKSDRIEILKKTHELLAKKREELIVQSASEGGKPYNDTAAEVDRGLNGIEVAIQEIRNESGREIPMGINEKSLNHRAYTTHQPRGPVVAISAFNHPFNLAIHQLIPAVATACPVIIKPAGDTPLSAKSIVETLHEAGLPQDYAHFLVCDNDTAEALAKDRRNSFLSFIGSSRVGWSLRSKLSPGTTCALEHGGAAPVIVDESADLEQIIGGLVKASYYHAGQVCVSAQRIYVHKSIQSQFLERFTNEVNKLKTGDPLSKETDCGPLIRTKENDRVESWVKEATQEGAEVLTGGKKINESCFEPTILLEPKNESKVSKEEIFGPVTCVYAFEDLNQAIRSANQLDFAFQASIYTSDIHRALKAADEMEGLSIMINEHPAFRVDWMPFGGYRRSGLGVGGIGYSMRDMSIEKMILIKNLEA